MAYQRELDLGFPPYKPEKTRTYYPRRKETGKKLSPFDKLSRPDWLEECQGPITVERFSYNSRPKNS